MTTDLLFKHFHLLADTPGGVQKLRELILQLAVQGRLVPQNPEEEPASVLLEKIREEKKRLVREEKIKKQKPLPGIKPEEIPFGLPPGWEWARLKYISFDLGQKKPDMEFTYIDVASIENTSGKVSRDLQVIQPQNAPSRARKIVLKDTVIFSTVRPYLLNIAVIEDDYSPEPIASTAFAILHPCSGISSKFLLYYLRSNVFIDYVNSKMTGIAYPAINDSNFFSGPIPIPPSSEQHRIVSKVDQLMALCDELEAKKEKQQTTHARLNKSALHTLRESMTRNELTHNWTRIKNNFHHLFTTPESIQELRSTILQLAVQGRLVPQNPEEEPASVLLEKIREEKKRLIKEGKIKKQKPLPEIRPEEVPFDLPQGWEWVRFQDLGIFGRGKSKHRPRNDPVLYKDGNIPVVQTGDIARANGHVKTYTGLYNQKGLSQSTLWPKGTLCITIAANIADSAILSFDSCFPDSVVGFVPSAYINDARYFDYFMRTTKKDLLSYAPSTAQKNINLGILNQLLIPLPPQQEMKRIVSKVDHLMSFCDELENNFSQSQSDGEKLMEAVVAELSEQNIMKGSMRMVNANNHLPVSSACSG